MALLKVTNIGELGKQGATPLQAACNLRKEEEFELVGSTVIGRDNSADIQIINGSISHKHCRLDPKSNSFTIQDLQSKNGTWLNKKKLDPEMEQLLSSKDIIRVGVVELMFLLDRKDAKDTVVDVET